MTKKRHVRRTKTKTAQPSGRPDEGAVHGRDRFAPPRLSPSGGSPRLPGHRAR